MSIWFRQFTLDEVREFQHDTMGEHLGIEIVAIGSDHLEAKMPVDHRTMQPDRILHGGASVALAETLGSVGGSMCVDRERFQIVGQEINANHLRPAIGRTRDRARPADPSRTPEPGVEHRDHRRRQAAHLRLASDDRYTRTMRIAADFCVAMFCGDGLRPDRIALSAG